MHRRFTFVAVLVASLIAVAVSAQRRPDFSGQWTLVSEKSTPPNTWALGQEFAITQDDTTLVFERPMVQIHFSSAGGSTSTAGAPAKIVYNLNGTETRHIAEPASPAARPAAASMMTLSIEESSSTATWAGDHLVLLTLSTLKTTQPNREPTVTRVRQTVRDVLSLDADGSLVVEHLITVDPPVSNPAVAPPVPIRSVYRRGPR